MVYKNPIFGPAPDNVNERLAFVLMPFRDELTKIYESIVKPIVESKGLDCKRADDYFTTGAIIQDIWRRICESRLVIADTTGLNHNVMYELGIAHAVGKNTIIIHQRKDIPEKMPFDFAHIRRIEYEDDAVGAKKLERDLEQTLSTVLKEPFTGVISEDGTPTLLRSIRVGRTLTEHDITITLSQVDFYDTETVAWLTIVNQTEKVERFDYDIEFLAVYCRAFQGRKQFTYRGTSINDKIPSGIEEKGYVSFQPIDDTQGKIKFEFHISNPFEGRRYRLNIEIEPSLYVT